jgi:hypothetical protein
MPETTKPRKSSAERDAELRAGLEPYGPDERPWPLIAGTVVTGLLGLLSVVPWLAGMEIDGKHPEPGGVLIFTAVMWLAAWGLWNKRYWAVLGFQTLLAIVVVVFGLFVLRASTVFDVVISFAFAVPAGYLFWKLVRVLARIQTPDRPSVDA